jgi:endonuclease YncB( thermonuclease family)
MNERSIFMAALEKDTPDERSSYLDEACGDDTAMRQRVEALLQSHEHAGNFLGKPAPERLAEELVDSEKLGETQGEAPADDKQGEALGFLAPADKAGVLGRLGHYEVLDVIGRGGMGIVLRAFDEKLHRVVAIKVMAAQLANSGTARKRFTREAQAAAAVSHDHIVTIHAVEASPTPHMVMQYVQGVSLQQRLDREGPLQLPEILRIGMQTALGLAAAHAQGLIHRDIKPANILLENGVARVKITDFGMARAAADASLTRSGVVTGTPQYMAPEQARGAALDARTDLFSLGSVLYALCTGRPPFRASGSMAVLKRVCEETPRPIRETNPEVPDWLVAIIEKLHAKDPAQRFQSAAEVAELLNGHLARLQQPGAPTLPAAKSAEAPPPRRRRRWVMAAAVCLLLLVGGLSLTEATGVTNVRATVIRIFTPDGTLVVEVNDPAVKVIVEGDGGLVITGAGLEEIRLRPGNYRLKADKDGKPVPLERELVSIARGGREVVKVKLEAAPAPASAPAKVETGAFFLLGFGKERRFETLAEAVRGARDGDTIEIRDNGPFVVQPITIQATALTIRAGDGFRPVIKADKDGKGGKLLLTDAPLVLEGLDFQWVDAKVFDPADGESWLVVSSGPASRLHVANCRFLMNRREGHSGGMYCISAWGSPICRLCNCQLMVCGNGKVNGPSVGCTTSPHGELMVENCLIVGHGLQLGLNHAEPTKVVLRRSTLLGPSSTSVGFYPGNKIDVPALGEKDARPLQLETSANILEGPVQFAQYAGYLAREKALSATEAEQFLTRLIGWREKLNLYLLSDDNDLLRLMADTPPGNFNTRLEPTVPTRTLADWKTFWGMAELDSKRGQARFKGGDLVDKARHTPKQLTPEDFRLRADSDGYQAGKDKTDLGADVDLVGPGPAYERWKKTPDYQQWLRDTNQFGAKALKPEAKAFALLGGKGVEVGRYDTLAEAVQAARTGDTIEVRGNGPFVSEPIQITRPLTIRGGDGFRPVIKLSPEGIQRVPPLLNATAALVLEGLELYRAPPQVPRSGGKEVVQTHQAPLRAANCRFQGAVWANQSPVCVFRHCEFLADGIVGVRCRPGARVIFEDCLHRTNASALSLTYDGAAPQDVSIQIKRGTLVSLFNSVWFPLQGPVPAPPDRPQASKPIRLQVTESILDAPGLLGVGQDKAFLAKSAELGPPEAEATLLRLLDWQGERNMFNAGSTIVSWVVDGKQQPPRSPTNLDEWKQFWGSAETDSLEVRPRFQGGDLRSRTGTALDHLTPEDFRLRSDSAGYQAGKDKKDLGADVDLVGPGKAYERWKKTPDYQQWLKDTGQLHAQGPTPEPKAFALLGAKGVEVGKFDTLAEAVQRVSDGDTIEVRGSGPFVSQPIEIQKNALVIRAGEGFRPVIKLSSEGVQSNTPLLTSSAALVLEGLDLQCESPPRTPANVQHFILSGKARLHVANCRFLVPRLTCIWVVDSPLCVVRNCEFLGIDAVALGGRHPSAGGPWIMDNCVSATGTTLYYFYQHQNLQDASVQFTRNSSVAQHIGVRLMITTVPTFPETGPAVKLTRLEVSESILNAGKVLRFNQAQSSPLPPAEAETLLGRLLDWQGRGNLYGDDLLDWCVAGKPIAPHGPQSLPEWKEFWKSSETGCLQGRVRFQGGDLLSRMATAPERITPEDFRLRADSAGYQAGKDRKDLGAEVDLVGPGKAYERWKKTPEYQQWLKDTGR